MRRILALDLGTTTGMAATNHFGLIVSGSIKFTPKKKDHPALRWHNFRDWLSDAMESHNPSVVYYEEVMRHVGTRAAHMYGAFQAFLELSCYSRGIEICPVAVGTIKKFATGKGNADKAAMIQAARAGGYDVADDNEADALHLLRYAISLERA